MIYSNYCCRNGFVEMHSLGSLGKSIFENYGLMIESFDKRKQPAYVHIRVKTSKEMGETDVHDIDWDNSSSI